MNDEVEESLGNFKNLKKDTIGIIIEFLKSSEVKDLRFVSRALKNYADNEDDFTRNPKRPRHANLAMLKYKMLDEERIEKIINYPFFDFPPNCYYLETLSSQEDKIFSYNQYIVQGESVKIDEIKKNLRGDPFISFKYYYQNDIQGVPNYTKLGFFGEIVIKAIDLIIDDDKIDKAANDFKYMYEIIKKLRKESYEFEIPYLTIDLDGDTTPSYLVRHYTKYGIKKIS